MDQSKFIKFIKKKRGQNKVVTITNIFLNSHWDIKCYK